MRGFLFSLIKNKKKRQLAGSKEKLRDDPAVSSLFLIKKMEAFRRNFL